MTGCEPRRKRNNWASRNGSGDGEVVERIISETAPNPHALRYLRVMRKGWSLTQAAVAGGAGNSVWQLRRTTKTAKLANWNSSGATLNRCERGPSLAKVALSPSASEGRCNHDL